MTRKSARYGRGLVKTTAKRLHSRAPKNPFSLLSSKIASHRLLSVSELAPKPTVRIALVSMPGLALERDATLPRILPKPPIPKHYGDIRDLSLLRLKAKFQHNYLGVFSEALSWALEEANADIVCVNEIGFPSSGTGPMQKAADYARTQANQHAALLVAGTCHEHRSGLNVGSCFYPGCDRWGVPFFKQVGANRQYERINVPTERTTLCIRAFGLEIGILICLDLADYTSVAAAISAIDLDLLLVPAYTKRFEDLELIACSTSKAMPGFVALVNHRQTAQKPNCLVAKFGSTEPNLAAPHVLASGAVITTFEIDRAALEAGQAKREQEIWASEAEEKEDQMTWLFGTRSRYAQAFPRN